MKVKTPKGIMEVHPGQIISFSPEKAKSYIEKGKIKPHPYPSFSWQREWEEKGKFTWREKGELTIKAQGLGGGQVIKLVAGEERYDPDCAYPQFVLPDDFELIEALGKVLRVFPNSRVIGLNRGDVKVEVN